MTLTRRWGSTIQGQNTEKPHEYPPASLEKKRSHTPWRFSPLFVGITFLAEACPGRHFCSILILRFISLATFHRARRSKMQRSVAKEGKHENDTLHLATFSQLSRHNDKLLARKHSLITPPDPQKSGLSIRQIRGQKTARRRSGQTTEK